MGHASIFKTQKNGGIRLLNDFRLLNQNTKDGPFPSPNITDTLTNLKDCTVFSTIDMNKGYYQVDVDEKDRHKTEFVIAGEHYEFLRLPMGLSTSPKTFQRIVSRIFEKFDFVKIFLDDILIFSRTQEEHATHVLAVLEKLREHGGTFNVNKSKFFKNQITYLGKIIDENGIHWMH
ncbi:putative LTR retrotransposon [Pseudoloma neurophilia]|uniref:Putative LTR retrotransposon n=1 Tax=Pseudoloma neurophilia TaxID=146866 RepID=A0A0R0LYH0_9MICR|nr:putative LTR retrotransposon [Pseudoloma neurophilia]